MATELSQAPEHQTHSEGEDEEEHDVEEDDEEDEELQLREMAERIKKYRSTVPDLMKNTLASLLTAQVPIVQSEDSDAIDDAESSREAMFANAHPEAAEKLQLLKDKISSNISEIPNVLKRVNDCISLMDKLHTYDANIHPTFKKKKAH